LCCLGAMTWRWAPQTLYTLRRNTASIIKGLVLMAGKKKSYFVLVVISFKVNDFYLIQWLNDLINDMLKFEVVISPSNPLWTVPTSLPRSQPSPVLLTMQDKTEGEFFLQPLRTISAGFNPSPGLPPSLGRGLVAPPPPSCHLLLSRYTSARRQRSDLFGLRVKLPPVTTSLNT